LHRNSKRESVDPGEGENSPIFFQDDDHYQRFMKLLSILSKKDALQIFELISKGKNVVSKTKTKISKSNRYRILDTLLALELVAKNGKDRGSYNFTPFGEFVYENQVVRLAKIARDKNLMYVATKIVLSNKSQNESFEGVVREITRELMAKNDPKLWNLPSIELIHSLQEFDSKVSTYAFNSQKEIYLALRSLSFETVQALIIAAERGVRIYLAYSDWRGFYSNYDSVADPLADLLLLAREKVPKAAELMPSNPNVLTYRVKEIPFSFVVSDNLQVAFEICDPEDPKSFFTGIGLENNELAEKLAAYWKTIMKKVSLNKAS
jgi:hypothetical protein